MARIPKSRNQGFANYQPNGGGGAAGSTGPTSPQVNPAWEEESFGPEAQATQELILRAGGGYLPGGNGVLPVRFPVTADGQFTPTPPGPSYTPGTPGAPGYDPGMMAQQFPLPPGGTPPGAGMPLPPLEPGVDNYQGYQGTGNVPPGMMPPPPGAGTGMTGFSDPFMQSLTSPGQQMVLTDPNFFYQMYAPMSGVPMGGGSYAMGADYAQGLPWWYMMSPDAQTSTPGGQGQADFYAQTIDQSFQPGGGYYTTGQFMQQAFTPGSAMNTYIFQTIDPNTGEQQDPSQQMANFISALEGVVGATMDPNMLNVLATQYMEAYNTYMRAIVNTTDPLHMQASGMTLEQWLQAYGPQGG